MNKTLIIKKTEAFVRKRMAGETTGHDWWHTKRVCQMALRIAKTERGADLFVVQLAALLHDVADWKFNQGNIKAGVKLAKDWLEKLKVDDEIISHVCEIISEVSFKGANVISKIKTKEGMIVQDADRLDALGAIGIARCFATGAKLGREIYSPKIRPKLHQTFSQYKKAKSNSINHFYEKLFLLKERMHTKTAKKIAQKRERLMKLFLERFFEEWEGK
jgi:uncharacterized protein